LGLRLVKIEAREARRFLPLAAAYDLKPERDRQKSRAKESGNSDALEAHGETSNGRFGSGTPPSGMQSTPVSM